MSGTISVRERVRDLVMRHGWNATCYQTVNPIFEYAFYSELDAVVAFVRARGRRVVAGAPICPIDELDNVMRRFEDAESSGVLYFGAGERVNQVVRAKCPRGIVSLGAQPVWDPRNWTEHVLSRRSLRYQFQRARNKGVQVTEWQTERAENSSALRSVLAEWLKDRGLPPLHFLVEPETLDFLQDRRTFVAELDGEPIAFLNLCPVPQQNGWLTEQFPRRRRAPNGTVELLMHEAAQTVAAEGASYLTMGLVPFSEHGQVSRNPWWLRFAMEVARRGGSRLYSFKGLDEFKSKFRPESWEPVYASVADHPFGHSDLFAVTEAFTGVSIWRTALIVAGRYLRSIRS